MVSDSVRFNEAALGSHVQDPQQARSHEWHQRSERGNRKIPHEQLYHRRVSHLQRYRRGARLPRDVDLPQGKTRRLVVLMNLVFRQHPKTLLVTNYAFDIVEQFVNAHAGQRRRGW